jgi:flagellar hook protein FlgE
MAALAGRLSAVADNIANASTYGYKRADVEFGAQVLDNAGTGYNSGGVTTAVRRDVSQQGPLRGTTSATDLAISGTGFFIVQDGSDTYYLTRAGSFYVNDEGLLVNSAGQELLGYDLSTSGTGGVANGFSGLVPINVGVNQLRAEPTTEGSLAVNLPSGETAANPAALPSSNVAGAEYSGKTSMVVYDSLGNERKVDIYFSKTADETWEVAAYNAADAGSPNAFPYGSGPLATATLQFDATTGYLTPASASSLSLTVPGGEAMTIDLSDVSQFGLDYTVLSADSDGTTPGAVERVEVGSDGTVVGIYQNGFVRPLYQLAIGKVPSPDNLRALAGNNYSVTIESGDVLVGVADSQGYGSIVAGALEESNVDMASELTIMIEAQRSYTANSKVFQTGSDLMDVLVNLKR